MDKALIFNKRVGPNKHDGWKLSKNFDFYKYCWDSTVEFLINVLDGINLLEGNFPKI